MDFKTEKYRVYIDDEEGNILAELTFPLVDENTVSINKTYVSPTLRGQGVAGKIMEKAVEVIEDNCWKVRIECSYAENWFKKHPEKNGLLI